MTELHRHSLQGSSAETELTVPEYAPGAVCAGIAHIVVGGFHRAHQAVFIDDLLGQGLAREWGIVGIGLLPQEVGMRDVLVAQDHLYTARRWSRTGTGPGELG